MAVDPTLPRGSRVVVRALGLGVAIWASAVVQSAFINGMGWPYRPNLPLLIALCGAWITGSVSGAGLGFWAGWLTAALSGMFIGSFTFSYLLVGWVMGRVREAMYGELPLLALPLAGLGTLLGEMIFFLWNPRHVWTPFSMLAEAGLNLLLVPFVYFPLSWIFGRRKRVQWL